MMHWTARPVGRSISIRARVFVALGALAAGGLVAPVASAADRAYELVSPPDKGGLGVEAIGSFQSTADGEAVLFTSNGAFPGAELNVLSNSYVGRRDGDGWRVTPFDPPTLNATASQLARPTLDISDDLTRAVQFSTRGLATGAFEAGGNLLWRGVEGWSLLAGASAGVGGFLMQEDLGVLTNRMPTGGASDLSSFGFTTRARLTADAPAGDDRFDAYLADEDGLTLVNRMPDGAVSPDDATIGSKGDSRNIRPVSDDGRRVVFRSPSGLFGSGGPLYMRIDGTTTVELSRDVNGDLQPALFDGASADGRVVFLRSDGLLGGEDGGLYRVDVDTGAVRSLAPDGGGSISDRLLGLTPDGETALFMSRAALASGATHFAANLYVLRGEDVSFLGTLEPTFELGGPGSFSVSPNGDWVAFSSSVAQTDYDNHAPECVPDDVFANWDGSCHEVYVYDVVGDELRCASCAVGDGKRGHSYMARSLGLIGGYETRSMLDDGRVFFTSTEALDPADVNGRRDVYEWRDGTTRLVSPGIGASDSWLADVSADGTDVFIATANRLVGIDRDYAIDLYSAREGGGLASQRGSVKQPPCDGDGCQGPLVPPAFRSPPGSVGLSGAGDVGGARARPAALRLRVSRTVRGSTARLRVTTSGRGRVIVSGRRVARVSKRLDAGGRHSVRVRLTPAARKQLGAGKAVAVRFRVTFVSSSGGRSSKTAVAKFEAR